MMNGIDTILRRLDTDAKAEADAVLKKARQEAADITARYQAQAAQENVFDYVEGKSQTKGERVTESSRNFVGDCLAFVREFVEKEREQ